MRRSADHNQELVHHRFPPGDKVRLNGPRHYTNAVPGVYDIVGLFRSGTANSNTGSRAIWKVTIGW